MTWKVYAVLTAVMTLLFAEGVFILFPIMAAAVWVILAAAAVACILDYIHGGKGDDGSEEG